MNESDGSRRPGLAGWLTDKVEGLTSSRRPAGPDPAMQRQVAELQRLGAEHARLTHELDEAQVMLMGKEAEFKNDLQELQERNAELLDKIVKLTQRDRELQAKITEAKFEGTGAKDQVKKLDSDLRDLRRSHKAKEEQIAALQAQVETLEKETAGRPDAAQTAAEAEALTRRLAEALSQTQSLTGERDELQARLAKAEAKQTAISEQVTGQAQAAGENGTLEARSRTATGADGAPLQAQAAGKLPKVARQLQQARERRGAAAQKLLDAEDRGFATLPAGFVEALLDKKPRRRSTGEHRAARRGGGNQRKGRSRGGSRGRRNPG